MLVEIIIASVATVLTVAAGGGLALANAIHKREVEDMQRAEAAERAAAEAPERTRLAAEAERRAVETAENLARETAARKERAKQEMEARLARLADLPFASDDISCNLKTKCPFCGYKSRMGNKGHVPGGDSVFERIYTRGERFACSDCDGPSTPRAVTVLGETRMWRCCLSCGAEWFVSLKSEPEPEPNPRPPPPKRKRG